MKKVLVAYFSASGVTAKVAEKLAIAAEADLFEIVAAAPYSDADLDWRNKNSRSSLEMNDRSSRPDIASRIENISQYDTVFVGFPVWWYREPSIIDTFMEQYDFSGKRIVPFATSGSSGIGDAAENMQALAKGAQVVSGRRFPSNVAIEDLKAWTEVVLVKDES